GRAWQDAIRRDWTTAAEPGGAGVSTTPLVITEHPSGESIGASSRAQALARLADYLELTKPRIAALVLVAVAASAVLSASGPLDLWRLVHTLLGTALIAASASTFNQWLERGPDARMTRTADRPLPAGRLASSETLSFGAAT